MTSYQRAMTTALASFRDASGNTVTFGTGTAACTTASVDGDELAFIPDGARNAANADARVFAMVPTEGLKLASTPAALETQQVTWNVNGAAYTVTKAYQTPQGTTWRVIGYRVPLTGTSTADAAAITTFDQ